MKQIFLNCSSCCSWSPIKCKDAGGYLGQELLPDGPHPGVGAARAIDPLSLPPPTSPAHLQASKHRVDMASQAIATVVLTELGGGGLIFL